jgi:hypothetical protein
LVVEQGENRPAFLTSVSVVNVNLAAQDAPLGTDLPDRVPVVPKITVLAVPGSCIIFYTLGIKMVGAEIVEEGVPHVTGNAPIEAEKEGGAV